MKNHIKIVILLFSLMGLVASQSAAAVVTSQQAEELFDAAEDVFPEFFSPSGLPTLSFLPDYPYYRGPYDDGTFMAIGDDDVVYVAGGSFGFPPVAVGTYSSVSTLLLGSSSGGDNPVCDTDDLPDGINYSQEGNEITVTTDGCIVLPTDQGLCDSPDTGSQTTGVSVLSETDLISFELKGITSSNSLFLDAFSIAGESSFCTINADENYAPSTINVDVCFDITDLASQLASAPGVMVNPPVTQEVESTTVNSEVSDCFDTGADIINDNVSGDSWILQPNGSYLMLP